MGRIVVSVIKPPSRREMSSISASRDSEPGSTPLLCHALYPALIPSLHFCVSWFGHGRPAVLLLSCMMDNTDLQYESVFSVIGLCVSISVFYLLALSVSDAVVLVERLTLICACLCYQKVHPVRRCGRHIQTPPVMITV